MKINDKVSCWQSKAANEEQSNENGKSLPHSRRIYDYERQTRTAFLPTASCVLKTDEGNTKNARALCDIGSQLNFISSTFVRKNKLKVSKSQVEFRGINDERVTTSTSAVFAELCDRRGKKLGVHMKLSVIPELMHYIPNVTLPPSTAREISEEHLADPDFRLPAKIDVLLGSAAVSAIYGTDMRHCEGGSVAVKTRLGWVVFGEALTKADPNDIESSVNTATLDNEMKLAMREFWQSEDLEERIMSPEHEYVEQNYKKTVTRDHTGRYVVTIPFKPGLAEQLGQSRPQVLRRLQGLKRRLHADKKYENWYEDYMNKFIDQGILVETSEKINLNEPHYYIPHHSVRPPRKPRIVFDSSMATTSNLSLNDVQYVGPTLYPDLVEILLKARMHRYLIGADVEFMFPQIAIAKEHWKFHRVLWEPKGTSGVREYELRRVVFGEASSMYNAVKSLQQCAIDHKEEFPLAYDTIMQFIYVDDLWQSFDDKIKAFAMRIQLEGCLAKGQLKMVKWKSNEPSLLTDEENEAIPRDKEHFVHMLGLKVEINADHIAFTVPQEEAKEPVTKRTIASEGAKVFDPLGLISPVTIVGKHFLQMLWADKRDWGEEVDPKTSAEWKKFIRDIRVLQDLRIPRCVNIGGGDETTLHCFTDASAKAYGAAVYARTVCSNGMIITNLLGAKVKVAPLATMSIPRLELSAAQIGSALAWKIAKTLSIDPSATQFYTDSKVTIDWIKKAPHTMKVFVANRVAKIHQRSTEEQWQHLSSKENPADLLSRGIKANELMTNDIWLKGPMFLREKELTHRRNEKIRLSTKERNELEAEIKKDHLPKAEPVVALITDHISTAALSTSRLCGKYDGIENVLAKFSDLDKTLRVTALVFRFVNALKSKIRANMSTQQQPTIGAVIKRTAKKTEDEATKKKQKPQGDPYPHTKQNNRAERCYEKTHKDITGREFEEVTVIEMKKALLFWIQATQRLEYPIDYKWLTKNEHVRNDSNLLQLAPFMDEEGVMRVGGRLANARTSYDQRFPILLPGKCVLAR